MKLSQTEIGEIKQVLEETSFNDSWIISKFVRNIINKTTPFIESVTWFSLKSQKQTDEILWKIIKVLEKKKFWHIDIESIPLDIINIEDTDVFKTLLKLYIRQKKKEDPNYSRKEKDIFSNVEMFRWFEDFCSSQWFSQKLSISNENPLNLARIEALLDDFKKRFSYHVRMSTKYYDEIIKKLWLNKHEISTRKAMLKFNTAYHLIKQVFSWREREWIDDEWNSERSFEHHKGTMEIILRELPNPNINKIIISLLHDVVEDISWVTYEMLKELFSPEIADWVMELTKKDWRGFLSIEELKEVEIIEQWKDDEELKIEENTNKRYKELIDIWKDRRNEIYFWNLENLKEDILYVKFADRIHNLRTLKWMPITKIVKKINETEKYFLDVALNEKKKNVECKAYDLMVAEINKLKEDDDVKFLYDWEKDHATQ